MPDTIQQQVFSLADSLIIGGPTDSTSLVSLDSAPFQAPPEAVKAFLSSTKGGLHLPDGYGLGEAMPFIGNSTSWIFWLLFSALILITIIRFAFPRRFNQVASSLMSERDLLTMLREGDLFTERIMLGMMAIFSTLMGLLLIMVITRNGSIQSGVSLTPLHWLVASIGVLLWWIFRSLLVWMLGFIFKTFDATSLYLSRMLSTNMALGGLLVVMLPLAWYGQMPWMSELIVWILVVFNFYRVLRSLGDGLRHTQFGLSYLILFAFTVEALPLFLIVGLLRHNFL